MTRKSSARRFGTHSRRTFLAGVGATVGLAAGAGTAAAQPTATGTGTGTGTPSGDRRRALVPTYEEFSGQKETYRSQYLLISDPTNEELQQGAASNCGAVEWNTEQTTTYEVSILQKLDQTTEVIKGTNLYTPQSGPSFEVGSTWQIAHATQCDGYVALTLRRVDPQEEGLRVTAQQTTDQGDPNVGDNVATTAGGEETTNVEGSLGEGEAAGQTEVETETETGASTPGFGVLAGITGLLGGAAARLRGE